MLAVAPLATNTTTASPANAMVVAFFATGTSSYAAVGNLPRRHFC